jgi:YhcH/YjgK/YiaL family protein
MVTDDLKNAPLYYNLGERIATALKYLEETDFSNLEPGKYELDENRLYALVQEYNSDSNDEGVWEAHRRYVDVQYVAEGSEYIGYVNVKRLTRTSEYDSKDDYTLFKGEGDFITMNKGAFMILAPEDAHMPCRAINDPLPVKKVVVKVLAEVMP